MSYVGVKLVSSDSDYDMHPHRIISLLVRYRTLLLFLVCLHSIQKIYVDHFHFYL